MNTADINPLTLPSLPLLERSDLPNCSAVYFVLNGDRMTACKPCCLFTESGCKGTAGKTATKRSPASGTSGGKAGGKRVKDD
jgi:hypothetical protein